MFINHIVIFRECQVLAGKLFIMSVDKDNTGDFFEFNYKKTCKNKISVYNGF